MQKIKDMQELSAQFVNENNSKKFLWQVLDRCKNYDDYYSEYIRLLWMQLPFGYLLVLAE